MYFKTPWIPVFLVYYFYLYFKNKALKTDAHLLWVCVYVLWAPEIHLYLPVLDYKRRTPCLALICGSCFPLLTEIFLQPKCLHFNVLRCIFLIFTFIFENVIHEYYITSCLSYVYSLSPCAPLPLKFMDLCIHIFVSLYIFVPYTHLYTCVRVIQ